MCEQKVEASKKSRVARLIHKNQPDVEAKKYQKAVDPLTKMVKKMIRKINILCDCYSIYTLYPRPDPQDEPTCECGEGEETLSTIY